MGCCAGDLLVHGCYPQLFDYTERLIAPADDRLVDAVADESPDAEIWNAEHCLSQDIPDVRASKPPLDGYGLRRQHGHGASVQAGEPVLGDEVVDVEMGLHGGHMDGYGRMRG